MIYKIINPGKYVAAIFSDLENLSHFLNKVDKTLLKELEIESYDREYPIRFLEMDLNGKLDFCPVRITSTKDELGRMAYERLGKPLALYTVDKDFWGDPDSPGRDYMARISHIHYEDQ